jgi:hypothetical protein
LAQKYTWQGGRQGRGRVSGGRRVAPGLLAACSRSSVAGAPGPVQVQAQGKARRCLWLTSLMKTMRSALVVPLKSGSSAALRTCGRRAAVACSNSLAAALALDRPGPATLAQLPHTHPNPHPNPHTPAHTHTHPTLARNSMRSSPSCRATLPPQTTRLSMLSDSSACTSSLSPCTVSSSLPDS